jgi:CBS domain containing-hemolysin-like protein
MMKYIDIRAIVLATLAVFGIDSVSEIVLFSSFSNLPAGASDEQVKAVAAALAVDPGYLRAALILGTASTVVGGFLVARLARQIPYFNALAYGVLGMALSMVFSAMAIANFPVWFRVVAIGITVPASLLGAYFGRRPLSK